MWYYSKNITLTKKILVGAFFIIQINFMVFNDHLIPDFIFDIAKSSIFFFCKLNSYYNNTSNNIKSSSNKIKLSDKIFRKTFLNNFASISCGLNPKNILIILLSY